jgi:hypothetical protein
MVCVKSYYFQTLEVDVVFFECFTDRLAMLADASHECLSLIRFLDQDLYDVSKLPFMIETVLGRLSFLFSQRGCLRCISFTHVMHSVRGRDQNTCLVQLLLLILFVYTHLTHNMF